jgi:hypothetical protein
VVLEYWPFQKVSLFKSIAFHIKEAVSFIYFIVLLKYYRIFSDYDGTHLSSHPIPPLGRQKQEDSEFQTSLSYMVRLCSKERTAV